MTRATPLYFEDTFPLSSGSGDGALDGAATRPQLFGWFHEPSREANLDTGIILCDSVGHSDTRYLHRKLAEQLAASGFSTLRFDYHGTGDSSGSDDEPGLVGSWIDSINVAVDTLIASHNLSRVCLMGFRLGGTLALAAAAKRTDRAVSDLILWAPLARGKALCREIAMAQTVHYGKRRAEQTEPTLLSRHFFGFLPTPSILADLEKLDVTNIERRPAERAWLVKRGEQPIDPSLVKRLEELGVAVTTDSVITDPRVALHPNLPYIDPFAAKVKQWIGEGAVAGVVPALSADAEEVSARPSAGGQILPTVPINASVRETTLEFSSDPYLFGILSEPASIEKRKGTEAVLFLTSGASHHIGPGRLYVDGARRLAAMGYTAFRFDLSGIGDSPSAGENNEGRRLPKNAVAQVRLAMDALAKERGIETFALCGLCSGGRLAYAVALADDRVVDIQMINPPSLRTKQEPGHPFVQLVHVLGNVRKWHRAFKGGMYLKLAKREFRTLAVSGKAFFASQLRRAWRTGKKTPAAAAPTDGAAGVAMEEAGTDASELKSEFEMLARRGVKPLFIYSGKDRGISYFNHAVKEIAEEQKLSVLMYPEADHLFSEPHRELLLSILERHLRHAPVVEFTPPTKQAQPAPARPGSGIHAVLRDRAVAMQATSHARSRDRSLGMAEPG